MGLWHRASGPFPSNSTDWLIYPFFASGAVTLLGGQMKSSGKTTLVLSLLATAQDRIGFYNRDTVCAPAVYFTEQSPSMFRESLEGAGALGQEDIWFTSLITDLYDRSWPDRVGVIEKQIVRQGARYVVVDTFAPCVGLQEKEENQLAFQAVADLQRLASQHDVGVIIVQHTTKNTRFNANMLDAVRGHGSIVGAVDSVALLHNPSGDDSQNPVRWVKMIGRLAGLPDPFSVRYRGRRYKFNGLLRKHSAGQEPEEP